MDLYANFSDNARNSVGLGALSLSHLRLSVVVHGAGNSISVQKIDTESFHTDLYDLFVGVVVVINDDDRE